MLSNLRFPRIFTWLFGAVGLIALQISAAAAVSGGPIDLGKVFEGRDACFELVDAQTGKEIIRYDRSRCACRLTPCSTFKVPLALMAFEHGLIGEKTMFHGLGTVGSSVPNVAPVTRSAFATDRYFVRGLRRRLSEGSARRAIGHLA